MPPLSAFPKSQQVTFKYYEGVLCFLEENYVQVKTALGLSPLRLLISELGRGASHTGLEYVP